jgi:hypothetical protein
VLPISYLVLQLLDSLGHLSFAKLKFDRHRLAS